MEVQRFVRIFIGDGVLALRSAQAVVVYFVVFVRVGKLLACFRPGICAVVKSVAMPCRSGEFGPFYMVGQQTACGGVHDVYLCPVASAARHGVSRVSSVGALEQAGKSHRAVVAEAVGIKKQFCPCAVRRVGPVYGGLVAESVVERKIIFSVILARRKSALFVIVENCETAMQRRAERYGVEV